MFLDREIPSTHRITSAPTDRFRALQRFSTTPKASRLYDPALEHDACRPAMVSTLRRSAAHDIIATAPESQRNLEHRGAIGSDAGTGDGAGIITQIPDAFLRAVVDFDLPKLGSYAVGIAYLPEDDTERAEIKHAISEFAQAE